MPTWKCSLIRELCFISPLDTLRIQPFFRFRSKFFSSPELSLLRCLRPAPPRPVDTDHDPLLFQSLSRLAGSLALDFYDLQGSLGRVRSQACKMARIK